MRPQSRVKAFLLSSLLQTGIRLHGESVQRPERKGGLSGHGRGLGSGPQRLPEAGQLGCPKALLVCPKPVTRLSYIKDCGVALNPTNGAL